VNAIRLGFTALLFLSAAAWAAEGPKAAEDSDLKAPEHLKLDTGKKSPDEKASQDAKPKPELDVSRMLFDQASIRQVVNFHMPEIQECYEGVLAEAGKKIEGKVVVHFVVNTEGKVTEAKALPKKSTLKNPRVIECVLAMRGWTFPKAGDNRDHPIEYPFVLSVRK
jgi:hypothetical protein